MLLEPNFILFAILGDSQDEARAYIKDNNLSTDDVKLLRWGYDKEMMCVMTKREMEF